MAIVAVLAATVMVTANDAQLPGAFTMPGATAEPTGPGGPTGPGFGNGGGSQFQPPGWPQAGPGYSGGNYPAPPQGNGIDINNPSASHAAPEQSGAAQYPQQTREQPVHGTQPPDYDRVPPSAVEPTVQPSQHNQPSTESAATPSPEPSESSAPTETSASTPEQPTQEPRTEPDSQQDQSASRDNYRCLNTASTIKYFASKGAVVIELVDGTDCNNCDFEKPRENPNDCNSSYATGVAIRPATPGAEGGLESIMIFYTQHARASGLGSGVAVLSAGTPEQLHQFPAKIAQGAEDAAKMWDEIVCHAQASQIRSPSDLSKTVYDRLIENRDSTFQQFLCHFYGAPKKVWDGPGGINKTSWNVEWARAAEGTLWIVPGRCN
ncbi:hypothetical protein KL864_31195 [Mycolicibacterium goodii]|uniref:hypothetical protein n=1 Tax=Mycolicibacterium goodii TaxID=134601 RepID=UPI001BDDBD99|nr:hypothetical protein [Mycolicibacterium goodii]MBU8820349.1 hypothetical protein [Mycolicibacterium goodii]